MQSVKFNNRNHLRLTGKQLRIILILNLILTISGKDYMGRREKRVDIDEFFFAARTFSNLDEPERTSRTLFILVCLVFLILCQESELLFISKTKTFDEL